MKRFLIKFSVLLIWILGLLVLPYFLPATKIMQKNMVFGQLDKNKLLQTTKSPRIIFIGGSNLNFGLDSRLIKDSLNLNPINTGNLGTVGLIYMLNNAERFVKPGDVVVLVPEYHQFYGTIADGEYDLLPMAFDVLPETRKTLTLHQWLTVVKQTPLYASVKLNPVNYLKKTDGSVDIHERRAFNQYGDTYLHWSWQRAFIGDYKEIEGALNERAFSRMAEFKKALQERKAKLYISFPPYSEGSFNNSPQQINYIYNRFKAAGYQCLGTPQQFKFSSDLIFNTPYHLTHQGGILRTRMLIKLLKERENLHVE